MLFLLSILVAFAAVATLIFLVRRQDRRELSENQSPAFIHEENYRSLFAPDEEELAREEREKAITEQSDAARREQEKKLASFNQLLQTWRESTSRMNTIELLRCASELGRGQVYLDTVDEVLHNRPDGFSNDDLAQLIDSHYWLLPAHERTPGAAYIIKQTVAALRGDTKATSDEEASAA